MIETKRFKYVLACMLSAIVLCIGAIAALIAVNNHSVYAAENKNIGSTFYYDELKSSPLAQKFYNIMLEIAGNGQFDKAATEYDLSNVLSQREIMDYAESGKPTIPVALGAARDAFYMDHPELFYVDVYKLVLTVGVDGDNYVAYLGPGNADNYFEDNTFNESTLAEAKRKFDLALDEAVAAAKADNADTVGKIKNANKYIAEKTSYDYGARDNMQGGVEYNGNVNTAYGGLVDGKAICGGYSRAFKVVMDKLGIPCVLIGGAARSGKTVTDDEGNKLESGYEPHMWNAVLVDGLWYGVDVTWNDTENHLEKYMLVGDDFLSESRYADGVLSSSGFELKYPALRPMSYGVNQDKSGFEFKDSGKLGEHSFGYVRDPGDEEAYSLSLAVSYDGKNFVELANEGKYFAVRSMAEDTWTQWSSLYVAAEAYLDGNGYEGEERDEFLASMYAEGYTLQHCGSSTKQMQFAVFGSRPATGTDYGDAEVTSTNVVAMSTVYANQKYKQFMRAPYVKKLTPDRKGYISSFDPLKITITYSEQLVKENEDEDVDITVTGDYNDDLDGWYKVEDVEWDAGKNTVSFVFTPSSQYSHNCEMYNFVPTNLVGKDSRRAPEAGRLTFKMKQVVCPKVFNDGRLYMKVFGAPQFVSAADESLSGFKGKDGQPIVGNQRSQLMLVVNEPTQAQTSEMQGAAKEEFGLTDNDIKASSTYQIDLQMCGLIQKVPTGSYMQVGFGFPKGFDQNSVGVTFTVYHYTRDPKTGEVTSVEAVPCVVTEYGIIATVKSFSPFMICAVDSDKVQASGRTVYVHADGIGGSVKNAAIRTLATGDSVSYDVTCENNYSVDRITLNGNDITSKYDKTSGKLTLTYDDLASETDSKYKGNSDVEITFISDRAVAAYEESNLQIKRPIVVVNEDDIIKATYSGAKPAQIADDTNVTGIVVGICVSLIVVAAAVIVVCIVMRKKKATAPAGAESKTLQSKTANAKTADKKVSSDNVNKSTASAARPAQQPVRPASKDARPTNNASRPANGAARPTNQTRPATPVTRRPDDNKKK